MKKLKNLKSKIIMFLFALVLPLSASALTFLPQQSNVAKADSGSSATYSNGYTKEISLSNNNFNSVSTYSISTSLTGWNGLHNNPATTAGIINTGNSFSNYMTNTYRLAKNPNTKATDKHILMINSQTSTSTQNSTARQGYQSNSISLSANSYYSFQVSYKNDTNYNAVTKYRVKGYLEAEQTISSTDFKNVAFGEYVSFTYQNKTRYVQKTIESTNSILGEDLTNVSFFYEDDEYVGIVHGGEAVYVNKTDVETITGDNDETTYNISADVETYTSTINYVDGKYSLNTGDSYYESYTDYEAVNNSVFGSMYLTGLKDENNKPVKAEFVRVTSKEWVTFYFFVATGNTSQSVTLDLWLGGNKEGLESSGVVFYDDVHVYQYSENKFWQVYNNYYGKSYELEIKEDQDGELNTIETKSVDCVNLIDVRNTNTVAQEYKNFDFEEGFSAETTVSNWQVIGSQKARIFKTSDPDTFKAVTGYNFVGSTLSCDVELDEDLKATLYPNEYVVGLWAKDDYVQIKSQNIDVNANQIIKISANYKISELKNGNVYLIVEENDSQISKYKLTDEEYTLTAETASNGVTENGNDAFTNNYGTIEFFVKGSNFFNSSVNFSLALGKSDETATGCVVFDNVKIESATSEAYNSATNKVALDSRTFTSTIPNANFNNTTISDNTLLSPDDWTITNGSGTVFGGVINTETAQYQVYREKYEAGPSDYSNKYLWARYENPGNSLGRSTDLRPDNVLMLANFADSWQKAKSSTFSINANTAYNLSFSYKTHNNEQLKIRVFGSDGFKLYEKTNLTSNGEWKTFEIYLKSFAGADTLSIEIELDGEGVAYFDAFDLTSVSNAVFSKKEQNVSNSYGIVNMDNFYFNIPTNNITNSIHTSTSPAYTGSVASGTKDANAGAIVETNTLSGNLATQDADKYAFYFTNQTVGSYTIKSNFNFDLSADTQYYTLSFQLKTDYVYSNNGTSLDDKKTYQNGVTIGLTGFEYLKQLSSNDKYEPFTMYFKVDEDTTANLYIAFISDYAETCGSMAICDIEFKPSDKTEFDNAKAIVTDKNYDINHDKIFISDLDATEDDAENDGEKEKGTNPTGNEYGWLAVPTIITGLAIIIAIIGFAMRKVKIKKIERKRKESYDRKQSLNLERIKLQARKEKDAEINAVKKNLDTFETELAKLETEHKQKVVALRAKDQGKVSKETDKEFKRFAQKRAVIAEKVNSLKKEIETLNSPEYLLNLERKLYAQDELKQKELAKASRQADKAKEKASKKAKKDNKAE